MCGINRFLLHGKRNKAKNEWLIQRMNNRILHRGPDDSGFYVDGKAAIGMTRLSIIDLVAGKQPIANEDGRYQIVFNGEIYNYKRLRRKLISKGHIF